MGDIVSKIILIILSLLVQAPWVLAQNADTSSARVELSFCDKLVSEHNGMTTFYDNSSGQSCCEGFVPYKNNCLHGNSFPNLSICQNSGQELDLLTGKCPAVDAAATEKKSNLASSDSTAHSWHKCQHAYESAAGACDLDRSQKSAIDSAVQMANQTPAMMHDNCSIWGEVAQAANAGLGVFKGYCSTGYTSCSSTCASEIKEITAQRDLGNATDFQVSEVYDYKRKCEGLSANLAEAAGLMQQFVVKDAQMKQCAPGQTMQQKCAANPNSSPMCSLFISGTDCSNPQTAATNLVCVCQAPGSQALPKCQSLLAKGGVPLSGLGTSGTTAGIDGASNPQLGDFGGPGGGFGGGGNGIVMGDGKPNPADGQSLIRPGGGKANVGENGSGNNKHPGNNAGSGGGGGSGYNAKIIGGYGFGGNGPTGSTGSSGSGSSYGQNGNGYGQTGPGQKVDLRQFLPGGKRDPSRGLAGISGPDGITGPNSNIWQKINARYYAVSPTLLP